MNSNRVQANEERKRSGASGTHQDGRTRRVRTRAAAQDKAIEDQR